MIKLFKKRFRPATRNDLKRTAKDWGVEAIDEWVERKGYLKEMSTLDEVSKDIGVSKEKLSDYFRVVLRKPFLSWRKELRILESKKLLLLYPDLSLSVIGIMVGIDDKSNFRRQFYDVVGLWPTEYRKKYLRK